MPNMQGSRDQKITDRDDDNGKTLTFDCSLASLMSNMFDCMSSPLKECNFLTDFDHNVKIFSVFSLDLILLNLT